MEKTKKLIIIGAGELAMIAYEYFSYDSGYQVVGFAVEEAYIKEPTLYELPVVPFETVESYFSPLEYEAFVAIPASQLNRLRTRLYVKAKEKGYTLATYISSRAFVWRNAMIGDNCFIFEHNTVQPFVKIGNNSILWSGNHIGHQTVIEDHCFVSSHVVISGYCRIGHSSFIGVNSTFNDNVSIPHSCIVASGSLINKNLQEPEKIYIGSPARAVPNKSSFDVDL